MVLPRAAKSQKVAAALSGRLLDIKFCRVAYEEFADRADADIAHVVQGESFKAYYGLNPTEFIQSALALKLLPQAFDSIGYKIRHTELWARSRADWEIAFHYVKNERADETDWSRPFDPAFYREFYLPEIAADDAEGLRRHRLAHPEAYGSLEEALVRNGWQERSWVQSFDHQSYAVYNTLTEQFRTSTQALVHFIETGWRERLAISADREFSLAYYADLVGTPITDASEAYRVWVEVGLEKNLPANEGSHLRAFGLNLAQYPQGFDWRGYLEEVEDAGASVRSAGRAPSRWDALEHFAEHGVLRSAPLPVSMDSVAHILLAAGDRFAVSGREDLAGRCYDRGLLCPDPPSLLLRHAADHSLRQQRYAHALTLYRRVRAAEEPEFWTWCNGASAALALGEHEEAGEWVLSGLARHPRNARLELLLLQVQYARFERALSQHLGALRAGRTTSALHAELDAILETFARASRANYGQDDAKPGRAVGARLRVVVLANKDLAQCTFYRVDQKLEQLEHVSNIDLQVFERSDVSAFRSAIATADLALFYRLASSVEILRCIAACREAGVPTVYEVDDFIFDPEAFPDPLAAYDGEITAEEHFGLRAGVALVRHAASSCDLALASTEALAARLRPLVRSGTALVHRNGLSASLASIARGAAPRLALAEPRTVTLFYGSGTRAHGADFRALLEPAVSRAMRENHGVRFVACGHVNVSDLQRQYPGRVDVVPPITDRDAYLSLLAGVDINLAVLQAGALNDCKSEIKWLEAAAFCVPSIVSDVDGYRETLQDGVDVIRVKPDAEAWHAAIRSLVGDPARCEAIGRAARDTALALYAPRRLGDGLADSLRRLAQPATAAKPSRKGAARALKPPGPARRPRVLLVNVFFPPQSIGGATRVARDQAAEMIARYSDQYEIAVLCGNDEDAGPYQTELYAWRGAPVWSVGCPHREHMDWIAFDPLMAAPVDAVLDRFKPDIVHVHCVQRLTATVLERVAARGIPYVITAHDAWWISDHQFLMDQQDRLRMPWEAEAYGTAGNPHSRVESWSRRMKLRAVLDGAAAVVAVSETFASVYRRAGIAKTAAIPNGLPDLPPLTPTPPVAGQVRLAHLGGVMAHKGFFLLRQALARGQFSKLSLLVLDHAMTQGQERREVWGATPVRFMGRVAQERVGELYGMFDVLCAPSLWPESYGLVAREALHYGKWVIAGSRGAIGEDVVPGENGWVVDVSDAGALPRVFREIEGNVSGFMQAPANSVSTRVVREQVNCLTALFGQHVHSMRVNTLQGTPHVEL